MHNPVNASMNVSQNKFKKEGFADLRVKLGEKRANQSLDIDESAASELSGDEWAEIVKFQKERFEEEKQKK